MYVVYFYQGLPKTLRVGVQYSIKRVDSGREKSKKKKISPGEKPVRLKEVEVEKAQETNK